MPMVVAMRCAIDARVLVMFTSCSCGACGHAMLVVVLRPRSLLWSFSFSFVLMSCSCCARDHVVLTPRSCGARIGLWPCRYYARGYVVPVYVL